jgi:DNA invertase Pin-like site-specific DNA recombinase
VTTYGHARASMQTDAFEGQIKALKAEGCQVILRENFSVASRPQLVKLMQTIQSGDAVVVTKLDRLGRSTRELLELIEFIGSKGAHFKSIGDRCSIPRVRADVCFSHCL